MGLFNVIDARSAASSGQRPKRAIYAFVALAHVLAGSVAFAATVAAPSASVSEPASHTLLQPDCPLVLPHVVETHASDAPDDVAWTLGRPPRPGDGLAGEVIEADGFNKNPRKTGKSAPGCPPDQWALRRMIQAFLRVPVARTEHVSSLGVVVRSPRGPPVYG
jgi:hypothetical protein